MRPGDWVKNVFVLPAPVFALPTLMKGAGGSAFEHLDLTSLAVATSIAFMAFSLLASGFYCINDALDVHEDRLHPVKCRRPVASGAVSVRTAVILGIILIAIGIAGGFAVNRLLGLILVTYALLQTLYNAGLKRVMFVDVVAVAIGFALRAAAGAVAINVQISVWLILCVFFLCLYLGFIKRLCDIASAEAAGKTDWRSPAGYDDRMELNWLLGVSGVLAVMTYLMYALSDHARSIFGAKTIGFAIMSPFVLIAVHRFYRRASHGLSDSPLAALRQDRAVLASVLLFAVGTLLTLYVPSVEQALSRIFLITPTVHAP